MQNRIETSWIWRLSTTYLLALLIWVVGTFHNFATGRFIPKLTEGDVAFLKWFLWILFFTSAVHQLLVFRSLHKLDHDEDSQKPFKGWLNTWLDWCLRVLAIILLLCVGGELTHAVSDMENWLIPSSTENRIVRTSANSAGSEGQVANNLSKANQTPAINSSGESREWFPVFSFSLFFILFLWDKGAICHLKVNKKFQKRQKVISLLFDAWEVNRKEHAWFLYEVSDICGMLTWASVLIALNFLTFKGIACAFPLTFLFLYVTVIALRTIFDWIIPVWRRSILPIPKANNP